MTLWRGPGSFTQGFQGPWTSLPGEALSYCRERDRESGESWCRYDLLEELIWGPRQATSRSKSDAVFPLSFSLKHGLWRQCTVSLIHQGYIFKPRLLAPSTGQPCPQMDGLQPQASQSPGRDGKFHRTPQMFVSFVKLWNPQSTSFKGTNGTMFSSVAWCLAQGQASRKRSTRFKKMSTRNHK